MAIKGLDQAIDNLSRVRKNAIPAASAMTINRVATTAINQSSSQVARETKVRRKLVKERSRLKRATVRNPNARIIVNRGDLPVIKLGIRMLGRRPDSILKAGQHRYQRAFIQRLNNGRWHVMQRLPQARYYEEGNDDKGRKKRNRLPIQVVKIPMAAPLKQAFDENVDRIRRERLPKELAYALKQQLRIAIKR
ncbi:phage tail protein [Escherichia coli]|nr:phage tail protein [Escherichia coli]